MRNFTIFCILIPLLFSCTGKKELGVDPNKRTDTETGNLLESIELYSDTKCLAKLEEVRANWSENSQKYNKTLAWYNNTAGTSPCFWTRLRFRNPNSFSRTRVLYFPKGWQNLECYITQFDGTFEKESIGTKHDEEVLHIKIPARDTLTIYVKYPQRTQAYNPLLNIRELSETDYLRLRSRSKYKFILIGVLLFPILFFVAQLIVQKDKLSFYYILFLLGSGVYLLTMLDTMPYFELSPKIIISTGLNQRLFVLSSLLTLIGLVKYIHVFLDVSSWSRPLIKNGNILLGIFLAIVLIPIVDSSIFEIGNYGSYLQFFPIWALLIFLYILLLSIWAVVIKIKFSRILFLAFSPLIISGIFYAASFVLAGTWFSLESQTLILGFILTLLLFGVVLGLRNNATKQEKLMLQQQTDHLRELDQFKSRFYANITHEFRTPLTVIQGMADQISNGRVKTLIQRNATRLLDMVNQLLNLSKLDSQSLSIQWVTGDIIPFLQYLTESCHSLTERKNINLAFFASEAELVMDYDEKKVHQILLNLLSNGIKFTPEYGSIKVTATKMLDNEKPTLKLVVSDTGKGIPQEKLVHIFDRFYQVDDLTSSQVEGSGIGLAIVRELVQLLDGRITVESKLERGTSFEVYLPIQAASIQEAGLPSNQINKSIDHEYNEEERSTVISDHDKRLILIIEDNADVTEYICLCLQSNYELLTARNGREGVDKAFDNIPDVIISDIMMPEMGGFEVCRRLKADRRTSHIPIVLLTAKATEEDKIMGLAQGADAYLTKPFNKDELLLRLENLTKISQRLKERLTDSLDVIDQFHRREKMEAVFIKELHSIINLNMQDEMFDTQGLCRAITMSRTQLHRKIKALTGQSTARYIRTTRLRKAKVLLETTDQPIGEIAMQVGFKDFSHFSRSFAREFGMQPSETRK